MKENYEDILYLPHPVSARHPQMAAIDRAAQFSPFAALTEYGDTLEEVARQTDVRAELDECEKVELDRRLQLAAAQEDEVHITHFVADGQKEGGTYVTTVGIIKKLDAHEGLVKMVNGEKIPVENIYMIESDWV